MEAKINEIFSSIQGEGPVVGYKQLFIRFCGCNLNCDYCDTEFLQGQIYTPQSLAEKIISEYNLETFHSISLTGGEPLLSAEFLAEFIPLVASKTKIYLETNATLSDKLLIVKKYIDIIAADIKLPSATGKNTFALHRKFLKIVMEQKLLQKLFLMKILPKKKFLNVHRSVKSLALSLYCSQKWVLIIKCQ